MDELRQMVSALGHGYNLKAGELEQLRAELDKNGNGEIEADEFISWWQNESLQSPAAVATPEVQVDDDDMSEQARFLRMRQGLSRKGLVRGAEATQASLPATASGSATLSRVTIHHEPPKKKEYKYEVRSNRGRVEEQVPGPANPCL